MMMIIIKSMKSIKRTRNSLFMKPSKNIIKPTAMKIKAIIPMMLSKIIIRPIKRMNKFLFSII
jgi:hypothetical protein